MKAYSDIENIQQILTGSRKDDYADIERVLSILAQVSLAVLIIFVMIAILFASKYKDEAEYYKYRADQLATIPENIALINLQRQKLLLALERTDHHYRLNLGHLFFYTSNAKNQPAVNIENIITGRKIRHDFIKACDFALKELKDFDKFVKHYTNMVISGAELAPAGVDVTADVLDAQNKDWFENQVRGSTTALYEDTIRLQEESKEGLALYYQTHLSEVEELRELAEEFSKDPTEAKINLFMNRVNRFVENELQLQDVKFLAVTQKLQG